ncbi:unnamed protein product [Prunus armeniaca]|uniref:Sulfotransferase n=1 Tax=Prunus armeniaca TaxID=36596 RepID=A0A6J5W950_PRUAR|nr:unnamed protein product [Prunus armeniaca]
MPIYLSSPHRMDDEEEICFFNKDTLVIKAPKKSPLILRMVVLLFAMVCGVYICLVCLKQINTDTKTKFLNIIAINHQNQINQSCQVPDLEKSEIGYVHYPKPQTFKRKECACNPVRYFAILSMQRSGSGWFETLLNSHINVSSNGEIFSVRDRRLNVSSILKNMDKVYNLDWFSSASKNECNAAVGFKWMLNQGLMENHEEIVKYFKKKGVSAIFLFRRNLLRRMISVLANSYDKDAKPLNGTHKSHVHSPLEAEILAKYKPKINATLLIRDLAQDEEAAAKAVEYFNTTRHIVVYYEDVLNNRTKLNEVQDFLRLPHRELKSRQVKIHTTPLSNQVENWETVEKTLKGTSYETFLHADYQLPSSPQSALINFT